MLTSNDVEASHGIRSNPTDHKSIYRKSWWFKTTNTAKNLLAKRTCLQIIMRSPTHGIGSRRIHMIFIYDRFIESTVERPIPNYRSVRKPKLHFTASRLRSIYHNWTKQKKYIIFFDMIKWKLHIMTSLWCRNELMELGKESAALLARVVLSSGKIIFWIYIFIVNELIDCNSKRQWILLVPCMVSYIGSNYHMPPI